MCNNILFSLIVPCYNASSYILKCIDSISKQEFDSNLFEVILVDDCSSDDTYQVLLGAKENIKINLRIYKNEHNKGPGLTRRFAAEIASGDYLCFCDSDDWLENNTFEEIQKQIQIYSPDVVIYGMSYVLNGQQQNQHVTSNFIIGNKDSYIVNCGESLCNMCIKKDLFLKVSPIDIRHGEDLALVPLILFNANLITHIDLPLYNYFLRSGSVSLGKLKQDAYKDMIQAFSHIENNLEIDNSIRNIVEFIGIKTVLYSSTLMAIKGKNGDNILIDIVQDFESRFPLWNENQYLSKLRRTKRIYLGSLYFRKWFLLRIYTWLHAKILN